MMLSHSTMNSNGLMCPAMEPSYSHSSQDSMTTTTTANNTFYPDLDIPLSQSPIDSFCDYDFPSPPTSQYAFPDMDLDLDMYPVTTNTSYAMPVPCPQPPQYYNPSPFGSSLTSIPSSSSSSSPSSLSSSSPLSPPPLQWSLGDESTIPRFSLAPPEPSPKSKPFPCACGRAFTRPADLKRHQTSVHFPVFQDCPVAECSRKDRNGFPRRDHLIEHLRSYHHLHIPKGGSKRTAKARCSR